MVLFFFFYALSSCFIADHARASHTYTQDEMKVGRVKKFLCVAEATNANLVCAKSGEERKRVENVERLGMESTRGVRGRKKKRDLCAIEHKVGTHSPTRLQILNTYVLTVCSFFAWVGDGEGSGYRLGTVTRSGKSGSNWWRKTN